MSILKRGADMVYTFRFIRMLVMDWKNWDAYKQGVIDEKGKRIKSQPLDTDERKSSYTPFIRLSANIKRLLSKIPGLGSGLGSFAAGLFIILITLFHVYFAACCTVLSLFFLVGDFSIVLIFNIKL